MVFIVDMPVPPEAAVNQPKNGYSPPCNLLLGFVGVCFGINWSVVNGRYLCDVG